MKYYAVLNDNNICTGISQLSGEANQSNMVEIASYDASYLWKKYDASTSTWSTDTYEPSSTAPIDEWNQYKAVVDQLVKDSLV